MFNTYLTPPLMRQTSRRVASHWRHWTAVWSELSWQRMGQRLAVHFLSQHPCVYARWQVLTNQPPLLSCVWGNAYTPLKPTQRMQMQPNKFKSEKTSGISLSCETGIRSSPRFRIRSGQVWSICCRCCMHRQYKSNGSGSGWQQACMKCKYESHLRLQSCS